jgi:hypothetical protein
MADLPRELERLLYTGIFMIVSPASLSQALKAESGFPIEAVYPAGH